MFQALKNKQLFKSQCTFVEGIYTHTHTRDGNVEKPRLSYNQKGMEV